MIVVLALVTAAFVIVVVQLAVRARRAPIVSGVRSMIGADGEMLEDANETRMGEHQRRDVVACR